MTAEPTTPATEAEQLQVQQLAMYGLSLRVIADLMYCSEHELLLRHADDILNGEAMGLAATAERFHVVMNGTDPIIHPATGKVLRRGRPPNKRLVLWYMKQLWAKFPEPVPDHVIRLRFPRPAH